MVVGVVLLVSMLIVEPPAHAQTCVTTLGQAVSRHGAATARLSASRGVSNDEQDLTVDVETAVHRLAQVLARPGLLVYGREGVNLCVWLVLPHATLHGVSQLSSEKLVALGATTRRALGVTAGQAGRAPRLRGARVDSVHGGTSVQSAEQELARAAAALFPAAISAGLHGVETLLVSPVEGIGSLPLAMLPRNPGGPRLHERMSVVVLPSLASLMRIVEAPDAYRWSGSTTDRTAFVAGDPDFSAEREFVLPPLPGARREAQAIGRALGVKPILGSAATRTRVLEGLASASLVFLSTHGVASSDEPLDESFLAFSDGRLTARQIQHNRTRARLVVLGACQTGLGAVHDAGVIGIARAFQLAGATGVLMTLWNIDDAATEHFTRAMLKELNSMPPHEAVRKAMQVTRARYAFAAKWGSFQYFGLPMWMAR